MDGRVSDFDDISILFMKMQKEFCSRLCSKYTHKLLCRVFSSKGHLSFVGPALVSPERFVAIALAGAWLMVWDISTSFCCVQGDSKL